MDAQPEARRGIVALLPFLVAGVVAVVGIVVVVVVNAVGGPPAVHRVTLDIDGTLPSGWSLTGAAQLDSDDGRTTTLDVEVSRDDASAAVPVLAATFDGSGGGDALVVTCRTAAGATWTVSTGDAQLFRLPCDHYVTPRILQGVGGAHIGVVAPAG